jgi:hypothetical protein
MSKRAPHSNPPRKPAGGTARIDPSAAASPDWQLPPPRPRKWFLAAAMALELDWIALLLLMALTTHR